MRPKRSAKKISKMRFHDSSSAKAQLPQIFLEVAETGTKQYVRDRRGDLFLTVTTSEPKGIPIPYIEISPRKFKDNFSRCAALIKLGVVFKLKTDKRQASVYVRRHTGFTDPFDKEIESWRQSVVNLAIESELRGEIQDLRRLMRQQGDEQNDIFEGKMRTLFLGLTRMAIGHKPFEEGVMDESSR